MKSKQPGISTGAAGGIEPLNHVVTLTQSELFDFLLNVAIVRPVFIWGAPGIGKSSIVQQFAEKLGLPCVSLLGSQLAPEDLIGVPQISDGVSRFCPPSQIARKEPYCLFLDELNACSHEVQKSFYSLIHERRVGEYMLPAGSIVVGAGNRAQDSAIVKPMSSALINRLIHAHLNVSHKDWLSWASESQIHQLIIEYIQLRPDQLWSQPPKHEEPFSSPRSWHMLSDAMNEFGDKLNDKNLELLAYGCLSPQHATQFKAFNKQVKNRYKLSSILSGDMRWPSNPEDRDLLYFLAQSFRAHIVRELPEDKEAVSGKQRDFAHTAKGLLKELTQISLEIAQMVVSDDGSQRKIPSWFLVEIIRDLPRLVDKKDAAQSKT